MDDQDSEEDSDDSKTDISMAESNRRAELFEWSRFCKEKIEPIDKIWTKRLEDPGSDESDEEKEESGVMLIRPKEDKDE